MKKRLLFLGALALTSLGALAQNLWTAPAVPASDLVPGEKIYLYNKEAGGFLRGLGSAGDGRFWGSRAGVAVEGCDTVIFQPAVEASIKEGTTSSASATFAWDEEWDGQTYILQNYASHIDAPRWDEVWFGLTDLVTIWVDRQNNYENNYNFFWNVVKNANGNYEISVSPKSIGLADPDLYASLQQTDEDTDELIPLPVNGGLRIGASPADKDGVLYLEGHAEDLAFEWVIVSQADFATLDTATMKVQVTNYRAACDLKKYIDAKAAEYPEVDFSAAQAVYANTSNTAEELTAAKGLVDAAIVEWQATQATPDNPTILDVIENATFDIVGDFTGWTGTFGAGGTTSTCAECYNQTTINTYQDIKADLPVGIYKVGVKGFYRAGSIDNDWKTREDVSIRHAKLYGKSGADSLYTAIPGLPYSDIPITGNDQEVAHELSGMYVPNSMADFTAYKEEGLIPEVSLLIPVNDGKLRIGLAKNQHISTDWIIVDDFTLQYYGSTLAAYELYRDQILADTPAAEDIVTDETLYKESYLTAYTSILEYMNGATEPEEITSGIAKINPAIDALRANIKAYQDYKAALDAANDFLAEDGDNLDSEADTVVYLEEYLTGDYEPMVDFPFPNGASLYILGNEEPGACTLETEAVYEEIAYLNTLVTCAAKYTLAGGDCTNMLTNPSFRDGNAGWTGTFTLGGDKDVLPVAEVYCSVVDVYQVVEGAPAGVYSISVNAFERPTWPENLTGEEEGCVYLYMGDLETPVKTITQDVIPEDQAVHKVNSYWDTSDYFVDKTFTSADGTVSGYIPFGMTGGSYAFNGGRYVQECYGLVGDDGKMKIGLTSHGKEANWVLFTNFKLTFWGKDPDAMAEVLGAKVEEAYTYLENHGDMMSLPVYDAFNDVIGVAEAAVESGDYDQMAASITSLKNATEVARVNETAMNNYTTAFDAMNTAWATYESRTDEASAAKYAAVMAKVGDDAYMQFTTEELNAVVEEMNLITTLLPYNDLYTADTKRLPEIPTDEAQYPFDFSAAGYLQNSDFSSGTDFWELPVWGGGNNATLSTAREFWNGSASSLKFDLNQTLYALPEGKYTLEAELANSFNGQANPGNGGRAHLYADVITIGVDTVTTSAPVEPQDASAEQRSKYSIEFEVPAYKFGMKTVVGIRTVGTMDARWFSYDNFVLKMVSNPTVTAIEGVEEQTEAAVPVAIYNISGTRINNISKGINIIKMSDGSVKKVLMK